MYITKIILREKREEQFLTQKKLAILANVSQSTISDIENSTKSPTVATLNKIANALNIKTEQLLVSEKE